jgi:hypothetical protein
MCHPRKSAGDMAHRRDVIEYHGPVADVSGDKTGSSGAMEHV